MNDDYMTISKEVLDHSTDESTDGPYLLETITTRKTLAKFNPSFDEDALCDCGHAYHRHFDSYENMSPVGCKYCRCGMWHTPVKKAGLIPFFINEDGTYEMLFMISSDPDYGGPDPQISKGHVDPEDEGSFQAALREGGEEVGLRPQNVVDHYYHGINNPVEEFGSMSDDSHGFLTFHGTHKGSEGDYTIKLYAVEIASKIDFVEPCFETSYTEWMTLAEFENRGREMQRYLVSLSAEAIDKYIKEKRNYTKKSVGPSSPNDNDFYEIN